jgi:hypothetical protein
MRNLKFIRAAWPAFLAACLLELVVFAVVDPHDLHWAGQPVAMSRQGIYTISFFVFWAISLCSNVLTALLAMTPAEVNLCPLPENQRPKGCQ